MRSISCAAFVLVTVFVFECDAVAQEAWTYRARISAETEAARANARSPSARPRAWETSQLLVASVDTSWDAGTRLRLSGGLLGVGSSTAGISVIAREAYARVSVNSWMDVEAGKRLVRWGVGYGFSPTGVLDPPRLATDPTDRLGRNEGMPLARADLFRGDTSFTIAAAAPRLWRGGGSSPMIPSRLAAARVRTVLPLGFEVSLIAVAAPGRRPSGGASMTHVVGQRLEWHGELLVHDGAANPVAGFAADGAAPANSSSAERHRGVSAVAGFQYTLPGINVVMEYHRQHAAEADDDRLFMRAARAGADVTFAPELILIRGLRDSSWTTVAGLAWRATARIELYARALHLAGPRGSRAGLAPVSGTLSAGATAKF
jgi:hypothetical protein